MSTLSLRLPESIHEKLREIAEREGVSINQFINSAVAEKLSALLTEKYLAERARRGDRAKFAAVLAKIPDIAPVPGDELPSMARDAIDDREMADQKPSQRTAQPGRRQPKSGPSRRRPRR